jgi:integrase
MSTASKIFTLACQEGILDRNPMQYVTRLKEPPPRNRLLSKEEWERLWKELEKDILMERLCTLAANLPLRRGQLLAITPDALDLQNGLLLVTPSKGRSSRLIPVNASARSTLISMCKDGQLPFPLKETGIRKRFVRALKNAKIEGFTFHDLRHCLATELDRRGATGETIRNLFGHSDMKITRVYINPEMETMRKAVEMLDDVKEEGGIQ